MTFIHCYLPPRAALSPFCAMCQFKAKYPQVKGFGAMRQAASGAWYTMGQV